ncbi:MAG: ATP-dependent Clp protease adaptor ClpS [Armatimonadetes bacterium]|nr:ATP-dependent Clp protease adaptor ClpS [Armatimonadota bacterium]
MPTITEPNIGISPGILDQLDDRVDTPWVVILYNDDWHPIDQVVHQVQKATGYNLEKATWITLEAHHTGRSVAYSGTLEECDRVAGVLRQIKLQVETDKA